MSSAFDASTSHDGGSGGGAQLSSLKIVKRRRRSSRVLFNVQPNSSRIDEWLRERDAKCIAEANAKWNFDFERGAPADFHSSSYEYEKLDAKEVSDAFILYVLQI